MFRLLILQLLPSLTVSPGQNLASHITLLVTDTLFRICCFPEVITDFLSIKLSIKGLTESLAPGLYEFSLLYFITKSASALAARR